MLLLNHPYFPWLLIICKGSAVWSSAPLNVSIACYKSFMLLHSRGLTQGHTLIREGNFQLWWMAGWESAQGLT